MYSRMYGRGRPTTRKIPVNTARNNREDKDTPVQPSEQTPVNDTPEEQEVVPEETKGTDWKTTALRLQAEMDNFRKRQMRRADDAIDAERARLLSLFLPVADNLDRALSHDSQNEESLHQGVALIQRELMRRLKAEGVTRLETVGQPFTPNWHEAIATLPSDQAESGTIVEEIEPGYKLGDKLLRPARVVVAA